jgi:hypothetical protein
MTVEQAVLEKLRKLPPDKQQQVLEFVASLEASPGGAPPKKKRRPRGLWADLGFDLTAEDIDEVRREMGVTGGTTPKGLDLTVPSALDLAREGLGSLATPQGLDRTAQGRAAHPGREESHQVCNPERVA